ncbi:hypothetical protein VTO42DRAFT_1566 [Malbranchea cinnamomea]
MEQQAFAPSFPVVDVHTHVYPSSYIELLRSRTTVPHIDDPEDGTDNLRLIILSSDDNADLPKCQRGRPIRPTYSSPNLKISFMKKHRITSSILSLCEPVPRLRLTRGRSVMGRENQQRFGKHIKGVIMGTSSLDKGVDDPALDPVWAALELLFLHPHYGLPAEPFGGESSVARYGHVLPLALGFPLETAIAVTRMYLSRVFDRFPGLRLLLAHSSGPLPFLAGRTERCVAHERKFVKNGGKLAVPEKSIWEVLTQNIYFDAVVYGQPGLAAAVKAAESVNRVMCGEHIFPYTSQMVVPHFKIEC